LRTASACRPFEGSFDIVKGVDQAVKARWIAKSKHRESIVKKKALSTLCTLFSPFFDVAMTLFLTPSECRFDKFRIFGPGSVDLRDQSLLANFQFPFSACRRPVR